MFYRPANDVHGGTLAGSPTASLPAPAGMEPPQSWRRLAPERARRRAAPKHSQAAEMENYLRDTFASVADVGGRMGSDELERALKRAGLKPTQAQLAAVWQRMDTNGDGRATLLDFVRECGSVVSAAAFPRRECSLGLADHARAALELAEVDASVYHQTAEGRRTRRARRYAALHDQVVEMAAEKQGVLELLDSLQVARGVQEMELDLLRPKQERAGELERELQEERVKMAELQEEHSVVLQENVVCRRRLAALGGDTSGLAAMRSAFSEEQERVLLELQAQVPLGGRDLISHNVLIEWF